MRRLELTGLIFGRLTVVAFDGKDVHGRAADKS